MERSIRYKPAVGSPTSVLLYSIFCILHSDLKADFRGFAFSGVFDLEEVAFGEVEHAGHDIGGEHLGLVVVTQDLVIVVLATEGDLVFRAGKFLLQGQEVLVGLEVGIVLHGQEELAQGLP